MPGPHPFMVVSRSTPSRPGNPPCTSRRAVQSQARYTVGATLSRSTNSHLSSLISSHQLAKRAQKLAANRSQAKPSHGLRAAVRAAPVGSWNVEEGACAQSTLQVIWMLGSWMLGSRMWMWTQVSNVLHKTAASRCLAAEHA